jgi:hypothetical protein
MSTQYKQISLGSGETVYIKPSELTPGYEIAGTFTKTLTNDFGETYIIATADGDVGLNSTGKLKKLMAFVSPGSNLKIVYKGKTTIQKGAMKGKSAHDFDVFVSTANLENPAPQAAAPAPQPKKPNLSKVSG